MAGIQIPQGMNDFSSLYNPQQMIPVQQGNPVPFNPIPTALPPLQAQNVPISPIDQFGGIQTPEQGPQPTQMPPEYQHLNDVIGQYLQSKQQNQPPDMIQNIMQNRMQPTMGDAATAGLRETQSYASPQGFTPYSPEQVMAQRYANQYSPYTSMLEPQLKQAELQGQQITNQFMPQKMQADIDLMKANALMASGGGLFGGASTAPNGAQIGGGGASGAEFLKTLPPAAANMVQGIAEGRMPLPSGFVLKTPFGQQLVAAVNKYDPSFDFVNSGARMATRKSFTSGPDATNIAALNTAMSHLSTLSNSYKDLNNTSLPAYNATANYLGNQFGNSDIQKNTANVSADAEAVSHELAKVFRSTGMSEGEINAWKDKISTSASPSQYNAVINSALDLMEGRMQALSEKYNQGMGTSKQGLEMLSPQAQQAYTSLRGNGGAQNNSVPTAPSTGQTSTNQITATNPQTGEKMIYQNGQWSKM